MGLWEKFKSSFGGETTDTAQKVDPARFYEDANTELKPKAHLETIAKVASDSSPTETYEMALNYYRVSHGEYKQDLPKAIRLFEKAAEANHPYANMYLGIMYSYGMGCMKDRAKTVKYWIKASELGVGEAYRYLADLYSDEKYSSFNISEALNYYYKYFKTETFETNGVNSELKNELNFLFRGECLKEYCELVSKIRDPAVDDFAQQYKTEIIQCYLSWIETYTEFADEEGDDDGSYHENIEHCRKMALKFDPEHYFPPYSNGDLNELKCSFDSSDSDDDFIDGLQLNNHEENSELDEAEASYLAGSIHYHGMGDTLQDYEEALEYFMQAFSLGHTEVCQRIATMYLNGEGCDVDTNKALTFFKEGAKRGDENCYAEMASLFIVSEHYENARKCWDKYFGSVKFNNDADGRAGYACDYLRHAYMHLIPFSHKSRLLGIKPEIKAMLNRISEINCDSDTTAVTENIYSFLIAE